MRKAESSSFSAVLVFGDLCCNQKSIWPIRATPADQSSSPLPLGKPYRSRLAPGGSIGVLPGEFWRAQLASDLPHLRTQTLLEPNRSGQDLRGAGGSEKLVHDKHFQSNTTQRGCDVDPLTGLQTAVNGEDGWRAGEKLAISVVNFCGGRHIRQKTEAASHFPSRHITPTN